MKKTYKILSVGGSIIIPNSGFDIPFLERFINCIKKRVTSGERFILIVGGGNTARAYQAAASQISTVTNDDLDWIGVEATKINAVFVRYLLKVFSYASIVTDPRIKILTPRPVIVAAGWKPGRSTDYGAVMFAKTYGATDIVNLSNIIGVYNKDPRKCSDAYLLKDISWKKFRKDIVGDTWVPGKSAPFDPIASKAAEKLGLHVRIVKGTDLKQVENALDSKEFNGTLIHP